MASRNACLLTVLAFGLTLCSTAYAQAAAAAGTSAAAAAGGSSSAAAAGGSSAAAAAASSTLPAAAATPSPVPLAVPGLAGIPLIATTAATQAQQAVSQFQATFCTPANYVPAAAAPAKYTGKALSITFSSGSCTQPLPSKPTAPLSPPPPKSASSPPPNTKSSPPPVGVSATVNITSSASTSGSTVASNILNCIQPSLVIQTNPAFYASKTGGVATFTGAYCKVSGKFGTGDFKVLYTFDDKTPMNPKTLASSLYGQIGSLITPVSTASQGISALFTPVVLPSAATSAATAAAPAVSTGAAAAAAAAAGPASSAAAAAAAGR